MGNEKSNIDLSIITPVHNKAPYLKGYFTSLKEQDIWDRMEVICVENGSTDNSWEELNAIYNKLPKKDKEKVTLLQTDKANACIARNEGAKIAKGKYWSFLPADAALFPGMARIWVESLNEFPEYGFLYGGYRFAPPLGQVYQSEQYDEYFLKQYNYIDGSFPFRKELFPWWNNGGWDPDIKSLQDWDFWLAIVLGEDKTGGKTKGLYRPDICFETIPPEKGGLSEDSANNWLERVKTIKDKWGIVESDICVTSPGAPFHARNIAKLLGAEFRAMPSFKPHRFKLIYLIGWYPQIASQCIQVFSQADGTLFKGTKVIHWVGTDIWGLLNTSILNVDKLRTQFDNNNFIHLTEFEQTHSEMKKLGFETQIVPLPPIKMYDIKPFPKKFTVAVYMPNVNQDFYYKTLMEEVALSMPDIDFVFFGDRFDLTKNKNIHHVGYIEDMEKLIEECSAIIRLTVHDGLPISLLEFVMAGRNALFNIPMPHMLHVNSGNKDLIIQRIKDMQKLPANTEGSKYYRDLVDHNKFKDTINSLIGKSGYDPKKYWESRAESWETQAGHGNLPHENEVKFMLKGLKYNSVLDVGSGNGRWYSFFKERNKKYSGIDISEKLVNIAKQYYPEADFRPLKLEDIKISNKNNFDLAFIYTCLQHIKPKDFPQAVAVLKKIAKNILLIESPSGWDNSYGFNHDYKQYFNIVKEMKAKQDADNPNETLTLMLINNEGGDSNAS